MEIKKTYRPNIKKLKGVLNHPQIYTVLNQQSLIEVKKAVDIMERKKATEEEKNQIARILNLLLQIVMEKPITPILRDLVSEFIILTAFWNENIARRIEIRQKALSLRNFIDYHLGVIDTIKILKYLLNRIERIQKFSPPSFELSRHYLEALQAIEQDKKRGHKKKK